MYRSTLSGLLIITTHAKYMSSTRAREVNKKQVKAGAPTGIAAANIEIEGTDVVGQTIHSLFDLDNEYKSKLDFAKGNLQRVAELIRMEVLMIDEFSMLDCEIFRSLAVRLVDPSLGMQWDPMRACMVERLF